MPRIKFFVWCKVRRFNQKIDETIEGNLPAEVIPCLLSCVEFASIKSRQDLDEPDRIIQEVNSSQELSTVETSNISVNLLKIFLL